MLTKIDCVMAYEPIRKILKSEEMSEKAKIEMALEIIEEILKQAEDNTK